MLEAIGKHFTVADKRIERAYLELTRSLYADFPHGPFCDSESPDFLFTSDRSLGVEVTRLLQRPRESKMTPRQQESFREAIIRRAEKLYYEEGGLPVEVVAYSSIRPIGRQDLEATASAIAQFVLARYRPEARTAVYREGSPTVRLPPGLGVLGVATPLLGLRRSWFLGALGNTVLLTRDLLAGEISKKSMRVPRYREKASEVWLLIVADLFPSSASFSVPEAVANWEFDFAFDRVLLFSREESKVWVLRHK